MTCRSLLGTAVVAAPLAALAAAPPVPAAGPSMEQLINLAEHSSDRHYYGRLLMQALTETGRIADDNGDGTVSLYSAEANEAWRKETVSGSGRPIPASVLPHIRPANRGEDFPVGVPFEPLS